MIYRLDKARLDKARLDKVRLDKVRLDKVRLNKAKLANLFYWAGFLALLLFNATVVHACPCAEYDRVAAKAESKSETKAEILTSEKGLSYSRSNQYRKEFAKAIREARAFCSNYLKEHPDKKRLAIVSDIDETLLDNRGYFDKNEKFNWPAFLAFVHEADAPAFSQTEKFLHWARKKGFAIFLLTGRPEKVRGSTIKNLLNNQLAYDGLYLRPDGNHEPAAKFKTRIRTQIEDLGFTIVVNIGDQISDLAGGHALDCQKLPNRLYFVK